MLLLARGKTSILDRADRFVIAGAAVAAVYIGLTLVLAELLGLPFQAALALAFATAVGCHFALQRLFVWRRQERFRLSWRQQVGRYLLVVGAQYGAAAVVTATIPAALDVPLWVVYIVWTVLASVAAFLIFGQKVFHGHRPVETDISPTSP
jgi:putative flippase GtrA